MIVVHSTAEQDMDTWRIKALIEIYETGNVTRAHEKQAVRAVRTNQYFGCIHHEPAP